MRTVGNGSFLLTMLTVLTACATPYAPVGIWGDGFSETQLDVNVFIVRFLGNEFTSMERAVDFTLLRSAELARENGYQYFAVIDDETSMSTSTYTTPTTTTTNARGTVAGTTTTVGSVTSTHGTVVGTATSTTYGGQTYTLESPRTVNTIVFFEQRPQEGFAFDAGFLVSSLREKYGIEPDG